MVVHVGDPSVGLVPLPGDPQHDRSEATVLRLPGARLVGLGLPADDVGEIVVLPRRLCWAGATRGVVVPVADISMHAVARGPGSEHGPCIYLQVGDGDEELRILPRDPGRELDRIWEALCVVSGLVSDDEGGDEHAKDGLRGLADGTAGDVDVYEDAEEGEFSDMRGVGLGGYSVFDRLNRMIEEQERTASTATTTAVVEEALKACSVDAGTNRAPQ
jgi:hypothetical protein